jgi:hypothetical protein
MPTPINAPVAGEIWHLSIEDLFQPVQEAPRLGGDGPFVINLSVSTAPITLPTESFTSRKDAHVYQIQVTEDGRTRFRLRLGPFATEDDADAMLAEVRDTYPGALTATASGSDLRVIESMQARLNQRQASQNQASQNQASQNQATQKAADKVVIEKWVSQKIAAEKVLPQKAAAPSRAAMKAPIDIIEAAVKAEIAKFDAEISIDIAWPTPELTVPAAAPAPIAKASAPPVVQIAPAAATKPMPPAPAVEAAPAPVAAVAVTTWVLPELDIPLPAIQKRPAAPVLDQPTSPPPKPVEPKAAPPLSLVGDAPVLTEVVLPRKAAVKPASQKPVVAAPVLTDAVLPKARPSIVPPINAPLPKKPAAVSTPAPTAVPAAAKPSAPVMVAPPVIAPPVIVSPVTAPPVTAPPVTAPPVITAPTPAAVPVVAKPSVPVMVAPPAAAAPIVTAPAPASTAPATPRKAPVLPQSDMTPRRAAATKPRTVPAKPSKLTSLQHVVVATAPAPAPREVKKLDEPLPDLESTQTIRALTPKELEDNESRWFVIQLALADHAFDPEAVPNLDLFSEYRLYSVAGLDQGRVVHALRLGFFKEEIGAVAVASYLAAYWDKPTIKRVSVAERERFADQRVEARKDVGATGRHSVIEITDELVARRRRATKALNANTTPNRPLEH